MRVEIVKRKSAHTLTAESKGIKTSGETENKRESQHGFA